MYTLDTGRIKRLREMSQKHTLERCMYERHAKYKAKGNPRLTKGACAPLSTPYRVMTIIPPLA